MPLPLLAVVGAAVGAAVAAAVADATLSLFVVALVELSAVLPEVEAFSAVLDALEDVPA